MALGMCYSPPSIADGIQALLDQGVDALIALSLYPHYSFATSGTAYERVHAALGELGRDLPVHFTPPFHDPPGLHPRPRGHGP